MNIFALSYDPVECAIWHNNKHIVKMPLETAQMLCTNLNKLNITSPYKSCHINHPCTLWAGKNRSNFLWLCNLGLALCDEYTFRYDKIHKCKDVINYCLSNILSIPHGELTPFALAMPDHYKVDCPITSYRNYYQHDKNHLADWKYRKAPPWYSLISQVFDGQIDN